MSGGRAGGGTSEACFGREEGIDAVEGGVGYDGFFEERLEFLGSVTTGKGGIQGGVRLAFLIRRRDLLVSMTRWRSMVDGL
jgi:hypothetical protein